MRNGYKKTEIGVIPLDWEVVKLVEVLDLMTDYVANGSFASLRKNTTVFDNKEYAFYVRLFDLRRGLGHDSQKYVNKSTYNFLNKSFLVGNEILIANIGANVGESFLMPIINTPATLAPNMIELKLNYKIMIPLFCFNYLKSHVGLSELDKVIEGSGQPKINKTKLKTIKIPLPPLTQQKKIAKILSTTDNKIEAITKQIEKAEMVKKGLMQRLLSNESWEEIVLEKLLSFKNGVNASKEQYGKGYKFINVLDIINNLTIKHNDIIGSVDISEKDFELYKVKYGDILFQRSSETREEVGQSNVYLDKENFAVFGGFVIRGTAKEEYNPLFMNYLLKIPSIRKQITSKSGGSTRYNIGQNSLNQVLIPFPPLKEQKKISTILTKADQKIEILKAKKEQYQILKTGLMQKLLTGEIGV